MSKELIYILILIFVIGVMVIVGITAYSHGYDDAVHDLDRMLDDIEKGHRKL